MRKDCRFSRKCMDSHKANLIPLAGFSSFTSDRLKITNLKWPKLAVMWCYWAHNATEKKSCCCENSPEKQLPFLQLSSQQIGLSQETDKEDGYFAR